MPCPEQAYDMAPATSGRVALNVLRCPFMWLWDAARFLGRWAKRQNRPLDEAQRQIGLAWNETMREATEEVPVRLEVTVRILRD
jgi:hypothetical protein